ncbi:enoyl-CoA hydratase-related protein [Nocardioides bruguierae]|uniref:Enoyl-CoA hydratase-related protein n=1 Tax=Nocardioides bruguierae TaxID=2945102 RepID=A0A9X2D9H8_9ACTN|nr:enoyl-CoA hydratase-related protein [Nocardioides bruguierae]MCM0621806.1 enoyl-CoA hydratase-related protein [Nocardioides bruguierae]
MTEHPGEPRPDMTVERRGSALHVTFDRPHRRNAFTREMYAGLRTLCEGLAADADGVRALVLRGAGGKAFAAGNDIADFLGRTGEHGDEAVAYEEEIRAMLEALLAAPVVTVAAVDGVCVGGGLAVATHCDLRLATAGSRFGYPIARTLGNALAAPVVHRCAGVFGEPLTREMLLASRLVDATRAHAVGAVMEVVDDGPALDAALDSLLAGLEAASMVTVRATKEQLLDRAHRLEAAPADDHERLLAVYTGPDFAEGVEAFTGRRPPVFEA